MKLIKEKQKDTKLNSLTDKEKGDISVALCTLAPPSGLEPETL